MKPFNSEARAAGEATARAVTAEIRAEMGRQRFSNADLARILGVTEHTAGRRLRDEVPFDIVELHEVAAWLGVPISRLLADAEAGAA